MKKVKFFMSLFKERDWLEEMATKGWLLKNMTLGVIYHFEEIEPTEKVYEIDRFTVLRKPKKNMLLARKTAMDIASQSGWDVVTHDEDMNYYFVKDKAGDESDEFYDDAELRRERAEKYRRHLTYDVLVELLGVVLFVSVAYLLVCGLLELLGNSAESIHELVWVYLVCVSFLGGLSFFALWYGDWIYEELCLSREEWEQRKRFGEKRKFSNTKNLLSFLQEKNAQGLILTDYSDGKYLFEETDMECQYEIDRETDITAMAIQALAPYRDRADVQKVIDRALDILSKKQGSDGSYSDYGTKSCESIAQVMMALIALDLDPLTDSRFVKNGNTLMDALLRFYVSGGGFRHVLKTTAGYDAPVNGMATEQAYLALGAYKRFMNGDNFIYDMTDGMPVSRPALVTQKTPARGLGQATVKWSKVAGAKGYQIQYGNNKNFSGSNYVNVGSVSTLSRTLKNLNKSKTCYFKVRAYKLDGAGNKIWGQFSSTKSCVPNGKVTGLTLKSPKSKRLKVSWTKVTGAKGYQVKYATNSSFKNSKTAATNYGYKTLKSLKKGKTYWVKVRAYQVNANGTKSYGAYSAVKKLKVK